MKGIKMENPSTLITSIPFCLGIFFIVIGTICCIFSSQLAPVTRGKIPAWFAFILFFMFIVAGGMLIAGGFSNTNHGIEAAFVTSAMVITPVVFSIIVIDAMTFGFRRRTIVSLLLLDISIFVVSLFVIFLF